MYISVHKRHKLRECRRFRAEAATRRRGVVQEGSEKELVRCDGMPQLVKTKPSALHGLAALAGGVKKAGGSANTQSAVTAPNPLLPTPKATPEVTPFQGLLQTKIPEPMAGATYPGSQLPVKSRAGLMCVVQHAGGGSSTPKVAAKIIGKVHHHNGAPCHIFSEALYRDLDHCTEMEGKFHDEQDSGALAKRAQQLWAKVRDQYSSKSSKLREITPYSSSSENDVSPDEDEDRALAERDTLLAEAQKVLDNQSPPEPPRGAAQAPAQHKNILPDPDNPDSDAGSVPDAILLQQMLLAAREEPAEWCDYDPNANVWSTKRVSLKRGFLDEGAVPSHLLVREADSSR